MVYGRNEVNSGIDTKREDQTGAVVHLMGRAMRLSKALHGLDDSCVDFFEG